MPLPIGTWTFNQSGSLHPLQINAVDVSGNVTGTLNGGRIVGFWDEISQRLGFTTYVQTGVYTGFLFSDQNRMPGVAGGSVFTLVGVYYGGMVLADADRFAFGWYAQIGAS